MRYLLLFALLGCAQEKDLVDPLSPRTLGMQVCYNPSSIFHLSECNDSCTLRDYTGEPMCFTISKSICENATEGYVRRACGLYRRELL